MILGLGVGTHFYINLFSGSISSFANSIAAALSEAGYTYDKACLSLFADKIYLDNDSSPLFPFQHYYKRIELANYSIDRYCAQKRAVAIWDGYYMKEYRPYIANARAVTLSGGGVMLNDTLVDDVNCFYTLADKFDDGGEFYAFTVMESVLLADGGEILNRKCELDNFLKYYE